MQFEPEAHLQKFMINESIYKLFIIFIRIQNKGGASEIGSLDRNGNKKLIDRNRRALLQQIQQFISLMSKRNPLLIVSSLQPQAQPDQQPQFPWAPPLQRQIYRRQKGEVKFTIKSLQGNIKYKTIHHATNDQKQSNSPTTRSTRERFLNKTTISGEKCHNNYLDLFIDTIQGESKESRSVSRDRTSAKRYTYPLKKEGVGPDFIRKSLLEPCQIATISLSQRNQAPFLKKLYNREFTTTRLANFTLRRKNRNTIKLTPETIEPWHSETIEEDQNNF